MVISVASGDLNVAYEGQLFVWRSMSWCCAVRVRALR